MLALSPAALTARITPRTIDVAECVASVLLAIAVAHEVGATNVNWAAFSGYMVMRGRAAETVLRGGLRIVGTVAGCLLALGVTPLVLGRWPLEAAAVALIGGATLYMALTARRAYAWLFVGLTFALVLLDRVEHPAAALGRFVETRLLETAAGTLACMAVSLVSAATLRRRWPAPRAAEAGRIGWDRQAARHAAEAAMALALLVAVAAWTHLPDLAQGATTIMAAMLVPVSQIGPSGLAPVSRRLAYRVIGCLGGAALGAGVLVAAQGWAPGLVAGTILGVAIGRWVEGGAHGRGYVGTQFVLAVLVTLVPDSYAQAHLAPGLERLSGILVGMAVLEPVLVACHWLSPARGATRAGGAGEVRSE